MDDNGSGKIHFPELADMVRNELLLGEEECPEKTLKRVWIALDKDQSGLITSGEFGAFMRKGEHAIRADGPTWRERAHAERKVHADGVRSAKDKLFHRDIKDELARETRASSKEVASLSGLLNRKLVELVEDPALRSWFKLFRHMDDNGSGKICYPELADMVRTELLLPPEQLPEKTLKKVWLALDKDGSGHITAGEFGAFMRLGSTLQDMGTALERRQEMSAKIRLAGNAEEADRKQEIASRLKDRMRQHEVESKRIQDEIEALLQPPPKASLAPSKSAPTTPLARDAATLTLPPVSPAGSRGNATSGGMPPATKKPKQLGAYAAAAPHRACLRNRVLY